MTTILDKEHEILKQFPEMRTLFIKVRKEINESSCSACDKNRLLNSLIKEYNYLIKKTNTKQSVPIPYLKNSSIVNDKNNELRIIRDPCKNCVIKHLSAALEYHTEISTNYPSHIDYAIENINLAISQSPTIYKSDIINLLEYYKRYKLTKEIGYLKTVEELISKIFKKIDPDTHLSRYRLIGQLVHAEEECWKLDMDLALAIQEERHKYMEDFSYVIDFDKLFS